MFSSPIVCQKKSIRVKNVIFFQSIPILIFRLSKQDFETETMGVSGKCYLDSRWYVCTVLNLVIISKQCLYSQTIYICKM